MLWGTRLQLVLDMCATSFLPLDLHVEGLEELNPEEVQMETRPSPICYFCSWQHRNKINGPGGNLYPHPLLLFMAVHRDKKWESVPSSHHFCCGSTQGQNSSSIKEAFLLYIHYEQDSERQLLVDLLCCHNWAKMIEL